MNILKEIDAWGTYKMKKRIFSAILLWTILLVTLVCFGPYGCLMLLILASVFTQFEFYKLLQLSGYEPNIELGIICGLIMQISCIKTRMTIEDFLVLTIVMLSFFSCFKHSIKFIQNSLISTILGVIYVPFMLTFPIKFVLEYKIIYEIPYLNSLATIFLIIAISKFSDVGGLLAGHKFGKTKLAPVFSPNKTIEGLIGSVIFSILVGVLGFISFNKYLVPNLNIMNVIIASIILSIVALLGDLIESTMKRLAQVKDSGSLIPGIGGMFDLTDSLLLSIPVGIIIIKYITN